jgi:hypothetical protein
VLPLGYANWWCFKFGVLVKPWWFDVCEYILPLIISWVTTNGHQKFSLPRPVPWLTPDSWWRSKKHYSVRREERRLRYLSKLVQTSILSHSSREHLVVEHCMKVTWERRRHSFVSLIIHPEEERLSVLRIRWSELNLLLGVRFLRMRCRTLSPKHFISSQFLNQKCSRARARTSFFWNKLECSTFLKTHSTLGLAEGPRFIFTLQEVFFEVNFKFLIAKTIRFRSIVVAWRCCSTACLFPFAVVQQMQWQIGGVPFNWGRNDCSVAAIPSGFPFCCRSNVVFCFEWKRRETQSDGGCCTCSLVLMDDRSVMSAVFSGKVERKESVDSFLWVVR